MTRAFDSFLYESIVFKGTAREINCLKYKPSQLLWKPLLSSAQLVSWGLRCSMWAHQFVPASRTGLDTWTRPPVLLASCNTRNNLCAHTSAITNHNITVYNSAHSDGRSTWGEKCMGVKKDARCGSFRTHLLCNRGHCNFYRSSVIDRML